MAYKQAWRGGQVLIADRWFASSKTCSGCQSVVTALTLADRTFVCQACGRQIDRDLNAAINLATWGETHSQVPDGEAHRRVINAHRREGSGPRARAGETSPDDVRTDTFTAPAT